MSGYLSKKGVYISATDIGTESSPTYTGLTLSGLTASTVVYSNASKAITSLANGTGYLYNDGAGALSWATTISLSDGTISAPALSFSTDSDNGLAYNALGPGVDIVTQGARRFGIDNAGSAYIFGSLSIGGTYGGSGWSQIQVPVLQKDAAYTLGLRFSTNPQTFNIYGTYTSSTNYERGFVRSTASAVEVGSEKGSGGGTARPVNIYTDGTNRLQIGTTGTVSHLGANGQAANIMQATVVVTTTAAATATATNLIPAGSMVVGVTCRNTTAVTGDAGFTGYNIGDGSDADRWGANVNPASNETTDLSDCTITSAPIYAAATSVVLTQVGGSRFDADKTIRVTVHYVSLTAPTS